MRPAPNYFIASRKPLMTDIENRIVACFAMVFPNLTPDQIAAANSATVPEWDSVAQINLLTVIGEEFGIEIDFEEFEGATSFGHLLERVRALAASA